MTGPAEPAPWVWPARRRSLLRAGPFSWELGRRTLVLGILNCTPDSFSDGGAWLEPQAMARRLEEIVQEGADIVDIGGESTRPGAGPVAIEEEWRRIAPAIRHARRIGPVPVSVDTRKAEVARRALLEGACMINDVSALRSGDEAAREAARTGAAMVLMHMRGEPETMQQDPRYEDLLGEVRGALESSVRLASGAGLPGDRILVDPGIGFGKSVEHNLDLIRRLSFLDGLGAGILVGLSRKGFLGRLLDDLPAGERLEGSLAAATGAILAGAHALRVHDVRSSVRAARIADALRREDA